MAEILNDLKLAALSLSNAAPQPTHIDGSVTLSGNATSLESFDAGKNHFGATAGATNVLTLPATNDVSVGSRYPIIQNAAPEAQVLVVRTASSSDTFSSGSYVVNATSNDMAQPGNATCQALFVINAATDAAHGIGSVLDCQVVAPNKWLLVGRGASAGTGATAANNYQWTDAPTHL